MRERTLQLNKAQKNTLISLGSSLALGICVLFIGLIFGFFINYMGMLNPILNQIPGKIMNPTDYDLELARIGWYEPLSIQFIIYFKNFFTGNWGESLLVSQGTSVTELMKTIVPRTIETLLLPIIIGLIGIKLGRIWVKKRNKIQGYIIRIITVIGLALPIFVIVPWMQFTFSGILPVLYHANPVLPGSPFITGFPLFDSIVSGNWDLVGSIILHGILPTILLSFVIIPLIIKQTQTNIERNSKEASFISNSFTAGKMFGILFVFVFIVEVSFNRTGFVYFFYMSMIVGDIISFIGCIFMTIILFSFTMFFSNIIPIAYKFLRKKIHKRFKFSRIKKSIKFKFFKTKDEALPPIIEPIIDTEKNSKTNPKIELKNYVVTSLKNPFTIVGLGLIFYFVLISIFPQWFTLFSLQQVTMPYIPVGGTPYAGPSPGHPLGTTKYGYDILALLIYGIRDSLIFGIVVTLIGLAGGSIFGFVAGRLHRYIHNSIIASMLVFFIIPFAFFPILIGMSNVMTIGLLLITIFTGIIANAIRRESNYINVFKVIIKYIPLEMAFGIMLYQMLGYIGLTLEPTALLVKTFNYGRESWGAFGATFWPILFIFLIMVSLILLHEGLKAPTVQRDVLIEPVITT